MTVRIFSPHLSPTRQRGEGMRTSLARRAHPRHLSPTRQRGMSTRRAGLRLLSLILLAAFSGRQSAQAQQKVAPAIRVAPPAPAALAQPVWSEEQIDQWLFQQDGNASGARRRLDSTLTLQVEDIERACRLTKTQKKKLQLAGRGDIKRFFDRYETVKQKAQFMKRDQQDLQEILRVIRPLQMTLQAGLFNDDSLLVKSLPNTLSDEQLAPYDAMARERRAFRHRANIELAVTTLEQSMPLRDAQRQGFIALLTNETKPPRKSGQYDYYVIMFQFGRLPEEKRKPLFDNMQWKVLNRQLDQFRGMELSLKQSGLLADEDNEDDSADAPPAPLKK